MSQLTAYEAAYEASDRAIKEHLNLYLQGDQHKRVAEAVIEAYMNDIRRQQGFPPLPSTELAP